jgi:hypothetical protein
MTDMKLEQVSYMDIWSWNTIIDANVKDKLCRSQKNLGAQHRKYKTIAGDTHSMQESFVPGGGLITTTFPNGFAATNHAIPLAIWR